MALIRFAARDPGGANVVAGFLSQCLPDAPFDYDVWTLPQATQVFERIGIETREFPDGIAENELAVHWDQCPADILITGTSHYYQFEPILWKIARGRGCTSMALNDGWMNLDRRFAEGRPDCVGAVDAGQAEELLAVGFSPEQIVATGHPFLSPLAARRDEILTSEAPASVDGVGGAVEVLFVSEGVSRDVSLGVNQSYGFAEFDSFALLHRAAAMVVRNGTNVCLAVKFHPYEDPTGFLKRLSELEAVHGLTVLPLEREEKPYPWILWADLVVGISTILLIEAMILGKPVISSQPGLIRDETFIPSRLGCAKTLTDSTDGEIQLARLIQEPSARKAMLELHRPFIESIPVDSHTPILNWIRTHTACERS